MYRPERSSVALPPLSRRSGSRPRRRPRFLLSRTARLAAGFALGLLAAIHFIAGAETARAQGGCYGFTIGNLGQARQLNSRVVADRYMARALQSRLIGQYRALLRLAASTRNGTHRYCVERRNFDRQRMSFNRRLQANQSWLRRHNAEAGRFDAQCTRRPMTRGGAQWNRCAAWRPRLLAERRRIMAIDRALIREKGNLSRRIAGLNRWRANNRRIGSSRVRRYVRAARAALRSDLGALLARLDALIAQLPRRR